MFQRAVKNYTNPYYYINEIVLLHSSLNTSNPLYIPTSVEHNLCIALANL